MRKIWGNKIFQCVVFIIIILSFGTVQNKLNTLQFILETANTAIEGSVTSSLIKDIKVVKIICIIIWGIAIGLYNKFTFSLNQKKLKNTNVQS